MKKKKNKKEEKNEKMPRGESWQFFETYSPHKEDTTKDR